MFQVQRLLENGGASCSKFMFSNITHVVCGKNFDENDIAQATDLYEVPSVTEHWIIMSAKIGRLAATKPYDPLPNGLFAQINAAIVQLSVADRKKLYAIVTFNGGNVERNFSGKTTHLICGTANGSAYKKALEINSDKLAIVTPDWLFECLKLHELIGTQLYHPRLLTEMPAGVKKQVLGRNQNIENDNQTLSSILGLDFDDAITRNEANVNKTNDKLDVVNNQIMKSTELNNLKAKSSENVSSLHVNQMVAANNDVNNQNLTQQPFVAQTPKTDEQQVKMVAVQADQQPKTGLQQQQLQQQLKSQTGLHQQRSASQQQIQRPLQKLQQRQMQLPQQQPIKQQIQLENQSQSTQQTPRTLQIPQQQQVANAVTTSPSKNPQKSILQQLQNQPQQQQIQSQINLQQNQSQLQQQLQQPLKPDNQHMVLQQQLQQIEIKANTNNLNQIQLTNATSGPLQQQLQNNQGQQIYQQQTDQTMQHQQQQPHYPQQINIISNETIKPAAALERSLSDGQQQIQTQSVNIDSSQQFFRQQSNQSHQIITHLNKNQQIIIGQTNQMMPQKHIVNTSTAQGQQIIQTHLQQQASTQQSTSIQSQQINQQQQQTQGGQVQFITQQQPNQQLKIIQNIPQQQQHQHPPAQRLIFSQQQFNQLSAQQQQQLLNNPQNQNVVIINQSGQQQIISSNQSIQQQTTPQQQQIQQQQSTNIGKIFLGKKYHSSLFVSFLNLILLTKRKLASTNNYYLNYTISIKIFRVIVHAVEVKIELSI